MRKIIARTVYGIRPISREPLFDDLSPIKTNWLAIGLVVIIWSATIAILPFEFKIIALVSLLIIDFIL